MKFRVHFILGDNDMHQDVDVVNAEAAAKQVRKEHPGAIIKKTKLLKSITEEA